MGDTKDKKPTYKINGKTYLYDDLEKSAGGTLNDYLNNLDLSDKDNAGIRKAYSDMMSGIKDGTVYFEGGRYVDTKARYKNDKNRNKDYYGIAANYIYEHQRIIPEYKENSDSSSNIQDKVKVSTKPSNSGPAIDYGITDTELESRKNIIEQAERNQSAAKKNDSNSSSDAGNNGDSDSKTNNKGDLNLYDAFINQLFGRTPNDEDYISFYDLDPIAYKYRRDDNRRKFVYDKLKYMYENYDSLFSNKTDLEKKKDLVAINMALKDIKNGRDVLSSLKYVLGEGDFKYYQHDVVYANGNDNNKMKVVDLNDRLKRFESNKELVAKLKDVIKGLSAYDDKNKVSLQKGFLNYRDDSFDKDIKANIGNDIDFNDLTTYYWYAQAINNKKNRILINATTDSATFMVINGRDVKLEIYSPEELNQDDFDEYRRAFTSTRNYSTFKYKPIKKVPTGRIGLKVDGDVNTSGNETTGNPPSPWDFVTYTQDALAPTARMRHVWDGKTLSLVPRANVLSVDTNSPKNGAYDLEDGGKQVEKSPYYQSYLTQLQSNPELAKAYATQYAQKLQTLYPHVYKEWFGDNGEFNFDKFKTSKLPNGKFIFSDGKNGTGHDAYIGRVYYDPKTKQYYKDIPDGYKLESDTPTSIEGGYINRFNLVKNPVEPVPEPVVKDSENEEPVVEEDKGENTNVYLNSLNNKKTNLSAWDVLASIAPNLISGSRLWATLRSNRHVHDIFDDAISPVLLDTYERQSPVTGAESLKQKNNREAAAANNMAARPFTSDASLQLAGSLQANKNGMDLRNQGFLIDDAEIKRTQAEALARQEDNMARRSQVANQNRINIHKAVMDRANNDAMREKANHASIDNFLREQEQDLRMNFERKRIERENFNNRTDAIEIENEAYNKMKDAKEKFRAWTLKNPGVPPSEYPGYADMIEQMNKVELWKQRSLAARYARRNGLQYEYPISATNPLSLKFGGKFKK